MYLLLEPEADNLVWPGPEDMSTILHTPLDTSLRPVTTVTVPWRVLQFLHLLWQPGTLNSHNALWATHLTWGEVRLG